MEILSRSKALEPTTDLCKMMHDKENGWKYRSVSLRLWFRLKYFLNFCTFMVSRG